MSGPRDPRERRREVVVAGHTGDAQTIRSGLGDEDQGVREAALGAATRAGIISLDDLISASSDSSAIVRRRVAEIMSSRDDAPTDTLLALLDDESDDVQETAAWACGEIEQIDDRILSRLIDLATNAPAPLVRESAVAALGAVGDPRGLPAILHGCSDKPAIRRRAVLALAPFDGPEVDAALARALEDRDWQVRQSAEDVAPHIS